MNQSAFGKLLVTAVSFYRGVSTLAPLAFLPTWLALEDGGYCV